MRSIVSIFLVFGLISITNAGFKEFTMHSRANCANNESISWHWRHRYTLWTSSVHVDANSGIAQHTVIANWDNTWRSAAVHWGEGRGGWGVWGHHWIRNDHNQAVKLQEEYVTDCSIYDGWWDK